MRATWSSEHTLTRKRCKGLSLDMTKMWKKRFDCWKKKSASTTEEETGQWVKLKMLSYFKVKNCLSYKSTNFRDVAEKGDANCRSENNSTRPLQSKLPKCLFLNCIQQFSLRIFKFVAKMKFCFLLSFHGANSNFWVCWDRCCEWSSKTPKRTKRQENKIVYVEKYKRQKLFHLMHE